MTSTRPTRKICLSARSAAPLLALALLLGLPAPAAAYIGPGAGFALAGSFFVMFITILVAFVALLVWPFRTLYRAIKHRNKPDPLVKRLIIVGFDGQDPKLTERFMAAGKLPNFVKLKEMGGFSTLQTSFPSISPVAWSSFATGTEPARHNIYDFLDRDRRTYLPKLSSTEIGGVDKVLKIGKWRIPLKKPDVRLLRKSRPLWSLLGDHNIWSNVLRVPITFPPEKFYGAQLSAMCAPDLHGTQGTFSLYTTRKSEGTFKEGGVRYQLEPGVDHLETTIKGPENSFLEDSPQVELPMLLDIDRKNGRVTARIKGVDDLVLERERLSDWVTLKFRLIPGMNVSGIARLMIIELDDEHFSLYMTPVNIDPENPAMPISHPSFYSTYLAKRNGHFCTLGLAEDTWALNERVIDDGAFLRQAYDIDREREQMFFTTLDKLRSGTEVCVFDATDRIQHLFWRYEDPDHPADREGFRPKNPQRNAIEDIYKHNDVLVGKVLERLGEEDVLLVISDHGFSSFRRGVNLNAWLYQNGYLKLKDGAEGGAEWLRDVDWSQTKAFVLGLCGMFLNLKGREQGGIVEPGDEARTLKDELKGKLTGFIDDETGDVAINELFESADLYRGPYIGDAPDFIIGYNAGYRTSWDCATGVVSGPVLEDNTKPWSGDHCIDPRLVPGILFSSHPFQHDDPSLIDIAPTALELFGVKKPPYMEGRSLFTEFSLDRTKTPEEGGK